MKLNYSWVGEGVQLGPLSPLNFFPTHTLAAVIGGLPPSPLFGSNRLVRHFSPCTSCFTCSFHTQPLHSTNTGPLSRVSILFTGMSVFRFYSDFRLFRIDICENYLLNFIFRALSTQVDDRFRLSEKVLYFFRLFP